MKLVFVTKVQKEAARLLAARNAYRDKPTPEPVKKIAEAHLYSGNLMADMDLLFKNVHKLFDEVDGLRTEFDEHRHESIRSNQGRDWIGTPTRDD